MEDKLTEKMKNVLRTSGYKEEMIYDNAFNHSELLLLYAKKGYVLDDELICFLKIFGDKRLQYIIDDEYEYLDFSIRKVLKSYPKITMDFYASKLNVFNLIPFAYGYSGEIVLVKDEKNEIYGIDDDIITFHGKNLWLAIENILNGNIPKRIDIK